MDNYILGILGITVSVGLFLLGYRQTVGAKKERIKAANSEIERILVRRIVLEQYTPNKLDLSRIIEGKARDFRVRPDDLLSEIQFLVTTYTRVAESDLILAEQRDDILERIKLSLTSLESEPLKEEVVEEVAYSAIQRKKTQTAMVFMGILASLIGGLISVIPSIGTLKVASPEVLLTIAGTVIGGLITITMIYSVYRFKATQEDLPSKASELSSYFTFESQVRKVLEDLGFVVKEAMDDNGYDFMIERAGRKILIEIKAWSRQMPRHILNNILKRLGNAAIRNQVKESIVVTRFPITDRERVTEIIGDNVKVMTLRELRNYFAHE